MTLVIFITSIIHRFIPEEEMALFKKICIPALLFMIIGSTTAFANSKEDCKIKFDKYLFLESNKSEGKFLDITKDTPGVIEYKGGALPVESVDNSKMYTFKTSFKLKNECSAEDLALYIGLFEYPFRIYLNGKDIYKKGENSRERYNSSLRLVSYIYLPHYNLNFDGENELVIQTYPKFEKWALDELYIGKLEFVSKAVFLRNFIGVNLLQAAFILSLATGFYFLIFNFVTDNKSRKYLYFSIFSFIFSIAYFNVVIHHESMNEILMESLSKSSMVLMSTSIVFFIKEFTGILKSKKWFWRILLLISVIATIFVFIQTSKESLLMVFGQALNFLIIPELLFSVWMIIYYKIKKSGEFFLPLALSFTVLFFTVGHDAYYFIVMQLPYAWMMTYGFFALIIAIFSILVTEQSRMFKKTVKQAEDLQKNKIEIEKLNEELTLQKNSFFRFVPTEFLQLLGKESAVDISLGDSSLRMISVLFSDIRKYTGLCENMNPDKNFEFLNTYLMSMEKSIYGNNGFVDKYIGDAIMALFTDKSEHLSSSIETVKDAVDIVQSKSAEGALTAALQMEQGLVDFNKTIAGKDITPIDIGIGVNTGPAILGTVGSTARLDTTVIGDAVNIASRLENLTKFYSTRILVSESTVNSLPDKEKFLLRHIDDIVVSGRIGSMKLYELINTNNDRNKLKSELMPHFEKAMNLYKNKNFERALNIFKQIFDHDNNDLVTDIYIKRCSEYIKNPPSDDWNGLYYPTKQETNS